MSTLITDIRQLRRRSAKLANTGTIPISFDKPLPTNLVTSENDNKGESHVLNTVSNRIIDNTSEDCILDNVVSNHNIETDLNAPIIYITDEVEQWGRVDELTSVLRRMQALNPNLNALLENLDLEPVELVQPPGHARLWELAGKSLEPGRVYDKQQAIEGVRIGTAVSQGRAELGFKLMLESKAIEPTTDATTGGLHTDRFYLGGSTPY